MAQEIEIEFNNLLTIAEFKRLKTALFTDVEPFSQINYYFETADFKLAENLSALRIRKKGAHYQLTLKEPHPDGLLETHDDLSEAEVEQWLHGQPTYKENTGTQLKQIGVDTKDLNYGGQLKTVRLETNYKGTIIVLDHSIYHNTEDFEFELEAPNRVLGEEIFQEILTTYDITVKKTPSKIERFFTAVKGG